MDNTNTLYMPLAFWAFQNPGLALPIISLGDHNVKIDIQIYKRKYINFELLEDVSITNKEDKHYILWYKLFNDQSKL